MYNPRIDETRNLPLEQKLDSTNYLYGLRKVIKTFREYFDRRKRLNFLDKSINKCIDDLLEKFLMNLHPPSPSALCYLTLGAKFLNVGLTMITNTSFVPPDWLQLSPVTGGLTGVASPAWACSRPPEGPTSHTARVTENTPGDWAWSGGREMFVSWSREWFVSCPVLRVSWGTARQGQLTIWRPHTDWAVRTDRQKNEDQSTWLCRDLVQTGLIKLSSVEEWSGRIISTKLEYFHSGHERPNTKSECLCPGWMFLFLPCSAWGGYVVTTDCWLLTTLSDGEWGGRRGGDVLRRLSCYFRIISRNFPFTDCKPRRRMFLLTPGRPGCCFSRVWELTE